MPPRHPLAVIVYKKSLWTLQGHRVSRRALPRAQWREWRRSHAEHAATLRHVMQVLREEGLAYRLQYRARLAPIRLANLVITVGGDGTVLRASHHVRDLPLLGVNSDPASSVGFFCCATRKTFRAQLRAFLRGALRLNTLARLEARLNGRRLPELILNECLLTHQNPAATSRYVLRVGGREETQASSGVFIATAAGSTAAARSAGGWRLPLTSAQFEFVVREPFMRSKRPVRLWRGRVPSTERVSVISLMPSGRLYLDGPHVTYPFYWGDEAVFMRSHHPLRVIGIARHQVRLSTTEVNSWACGEKPRRN